jgi:alpha-glucoside transport system permease protein
MDSQHLKPQPSKAILNRLFSRLMLHLILIGLALLWLVPSLGLLITSLRSMDAIATSGWWVALFQWKFTVANYVKVLTSQKFAGNFLNSLIITVPSTFIPILIGAFAAYGFACIRFKGRKPLFLTVIALMVLPLQTTWLPVLKMYNYLKMTGSYFAIWIAHSAYGLPFAIFLLFNFFIELPKELFDSARIDGCSDLRIFRYLVLPLSTPAIASLSIFQFVWVWNDLMNALIFLQNPARYPLTIAIQSLLGQYGSEWHLLAAGAFVTMSMPLVVFFALQRYFVRGITAGAVKG